MGMWTIMEEGRDGYGTSKALRKDAATDTRKP